MFQAAGDPVALPVALANTWDTLEDPPELLRDVASLRRFLSRSPYAASAEAATEADLRRVRKARARLREAFRARSEEDAVAILNDVLARARPRPELLRSEERWRFHYAGRDLADTLAASAAAALLEAIRDDGWERFGVCAGGPCCCVFVDRSKNRSRRYCSQLCADRVAQAAYRQRRRSAR